jgi:hypothetical protein
MNYTIIFNAVSRARNPGSSEFIATSEQTATPLQKEKVPATLAALERIPT